MYARVARWDPFPDTPWVPEVGSNAPGMLAIYHLVDDKTGAGLAIAFGDSLDAFEAATDAIVGENARRGPEGFTGGPEEVATYRVHAHADRWRTRVAPTGAD